MKVFGQVQFFSRVKVILSIPSYLTLVLILSKSAQLILHDRVTNIHTHKLQINNVCNDKRKHDNVPEQQTNTCH